MNMACACEIDHENRMGLVTLEGKIDGATIREAMEELFRHPEWEPGYAAFWDARNVHAIALAPEDLDAISRTTWKLRERVGSGRGAWVVKGELAKSIGILLAHRAQQQGHERRCFTDFDTALRWVLQDVQPPHPHRPGSPSSN